MASSTPFSTNIGPCHITYGGVHVGDTKGGTQLVVEDAVVNTVKDKTGNTPGAVNASIYTRDVYTNFQMHVEYRIPENIDYTYLWRGNSGVKIFGCYEVQIIDSYKNPMKPVQSCGAIYSNCPPLVNASKKPGAWQSFDILFHAPTVVNGEVQARAKITVLHNGVLVQDGSMPPPYPDKPENRVKNCGDVELQSHNDHSACISFRNVWIRRLF